MTWNLHTIPVIIISYTNEIQVDASSSMTSIIVIIIAYNYVLIIFNSAFLLVYF